VTAPSTPYQIAPRHHYSNGAPVARPGNPSRIERVLEQGSPGTAYYQGIVGTTAVVAGRRCDLRRGIAVDDAAGTISRSG